MAEQAARQCFNQDGQPRFTEYSSNSQAFTIIVRKPSSSAEASPYMDIIRSFGYSFGFTNFHFVCLTWVPYVPIKLNRRCITTASSTSNSIIIVSCSTISFEDYQRYKAYAFTWDNFHFGIKDITCLACQEPIRLQGCLEAG